MYLKVVDVRTTFSGKAIAAILELLVPGAGHYALGARKQALFWLGATGVPWLCCVGAALAGSLNGFWLAASVMLLNRLVGTVHCFFVTNHDVPSWRKVAAMTVAVGVALSVAVATVKAEVVLAFRIPSGSMYPALKAGDYIIVSRWHRRTKRGDIVAFRSPRGGEDHVSVKRVVASGGDTVQVLESRLFVNGSQVTTTQKLHDCHFAAQCELLNEAIDGTAYPIMLTHEGLMQHDSPPVMVPPGSIYVLGDNRDNSYDSRSFGPVPQENVIGRHQFVWFSLRSD